MMISILTGSDLARRILSLPEHERRQATVHLQRLVEQKRAARPPRLPDAPSLARAAGLEPDPWQERFLASKAPRILLNCTRQAGKSTMASVLAVQTAMAQRKALVLLLSPSLRQSGELFKKSMHVFRSIGDVPRPASESALRLELVNGSRIVSLPGKEDTVRGFSGVDLIIIDEAARVPGDLYLSVRPMLAVSGGRLAALSTPFGTRGWFYDAWVSSEPWERFEIPATECPRISQEFLDEERRTMGDWWFEQEYMCKFLDSSSQAFGREDVDRAFAEEVDTWEL